MIAIIAASSAPVEKSPECGYALKGDRGWRAHGYHKALRVTALDESSGADSIGIVSGPGIWLAMCRSSRHPRRLS